MGSQAGTETTMSADRDAPGAPDSPDAQGIFDERFSLFTDAFGNTCEQEKVRTAILIIDDPKLPRKPIVFMRGNEYDAAQLLAALLRQLRHEIIDKIS
jgi:hypothetical protein